MRKGLRVRSEIAVGTRAGGYVAPRVELPEHAGVGPGGWWWALMILAGVVAIAWRWPW